MDLSLVSGEIIALIKTKYAAYLDEDCIDLIQIINICQLYRSEYPTEQLNCSASIRDLQITTPTFKRYKKNPRQRILQSDKFCAKYSFFAKILFACLKIDVDLFDITDDIVTMKNNYYLLKALDQRKKMLMVEHIALLKTQCKNKDNIVTTEKYETYVNSFIAELKIIEKIGSYIKKLIQASVFKQTDNMLSLLLPFFYVYSEYIEEYRG